MTANDPKLVPAHYASDYLHWDYVLDVGMGYFEAASTKYGTRWRDKSGLADLRKALHYLNKLDESAEAYHLPVLVGRPAYNRIVTLTARFAQANELTDLERAFTERVATWVTRSDLAEARELLMQIIEEAEGSSTTAAQCGPAQPVPLTEENHHADRVGELDGSPKED